MSGVREKPTYVYVVKEEHTHFIEHEVIATSKAEALQKAQDGEIEHSYPNTDSSPTGWYEIARQDGGKYTRHRV